MTKNNDYYRLAHKDLLFLNAAMKEFPLYNNISVCAQQVSEKLLKSVAELVCPNAEQVLNSHNLRQIYREINAIENTFILDGAKLASLKDFYFDARYPGDNYIDVSEAECNENLDIMYDVVEVVNKFRRTHNLPTFTYTIQYPAKAEDLSYIESLYEDNTK